MLVSWNWLEQYVALDMPLAELQERLMMAGINPEGVAEVGGDLAIDLEITSNRPDCLGHIGIAREIAVLFARELKLPPARPLQCPPRVEQLTRVRVECPELCLRYTARLIRGVKVGPSPRWLARRLETVGLTPINNVVDVSNYVLMECGQPLHAFDFTKLEGKEIIVRRARSGESIEAIDHRLYELSPEMCIIADAVKPVAIGGVMGGAGTEISPATTEILVEAAEFDPVSIRNTARTLGLHSESSYRFERRVDPEGVDWASRRCCELILELAGGELAEGVIDIGPPPPPRQPIFLRFSQIKRILGIEVPPPRVREILVALGNLEVSPPVPAAARNKDTPDHLAIAGEEGLCVVPPSWRRDLSREIDLIEEVARIHGYERIPEDVGVPMAPSARSREDRVLEKVRQVLVAAGFDEAITLSVVDEHASCRHSPWTDAEALRTITPVLRGANCLRRSLVPSLLAARRTNESLANPEIELFEIARVYLPRGPHLPREELMLGITSGRDYLTVRGVLEAIFAALRLPGELEAVECHFPLLDPRTACLLRFAGEMAAYVGRVRAEVGRELGLRGTTTVAEVWLPPLIAAATLVPQHVPLSPYPAVTRDINLVIAEEVRWADVAATVRQHCGSYLEELAYRDTYRDTQRFGPGKKSLFFSIVLRWSEGTMTSEQADAIRDQVVAACRAAHGAELRAQ
jgi:phenylalanyl-tRNA synthetase beta chain